MMAYVLGIIVGILIGILITNEMQQFNMASVLKTIKKELLKAYEEGVKYGVVHPMIDRINEISKEQLGYMGAMERPNASAAHSRHKNTIAQTLKQLEEEKVALFKDILKSGADPLLTVAIDGVTKNMRASELLPILESGNMPTNETPQSKTDSNSPGSARTLHVVKSTQENTDDSSKPNPSDPKIH